MTGDLATVEWLYQLMFETGIDIDIIDGWGYVKARQAYECLLAKHDREMAFNAYHQKEMEKLSKKK